MYDTINMLRVTDFDKHEVEQRAKKLGLALTDKHWEAIDFIKKFYDYHEDEELQVRDYNNALKGKYADQGGLKFLYTLFPEGPVNVMSQLLDIPVKNSQDLSMGSVQ